MTQVKSTTVLAIIHNGAVVIGADGQATFGHIVAKHNVKKVRKLFGGKILAGFAGSTADAFTLLERFEEKLQSYHGNMKRSAIELAKDWRTDRMLKRLEAMLVVANPEALLMITGTGDVLEPDYPLSSYWIRQYVCTICCHGFDATCPSFNRYGNGSCKFDHNRGYLYLYQPQFCF